MRARAEAIMHAGESSQLRCPATKSQRFLANLSLSIWIRQKAARPRGQEAHGRRKVYTLLVLALRSAHGRFLHLMKVSYNPQNRSTFLYPV